METERTFLDALLANPADRAAWLVLADWLEEHDQSPRAEALRLRQSLLQPDEGDNRHEWEERLRTLVLGGAVPPVPVLVNSIGMELVLIPAGTFWMGSETPSPVNPDEQPFHRVTLTRPFYLGVYPVTQEQYVRVMGSNPAHFAQAIPEAGRLPVETVSFEEAGLFLERLSARAEEQRAGRDYRLPSEAEWEYACRAGVASSPLFFGTTLQAGEANCQTGATEETYLHRPSVVGSYPPNAFGLRDMHGNVWEWCNDWYSGDYYRLSPAIDPTGPEEGRRRVLRGGSWGCPIHLCRSAIRGHNVVTARYDYNGFRVALSALP